MAKENILTYKPIDIKKIISEKSTKLASILPNFLIRYLKRIIHENEINNFMSVNYDKRGREFTDATLKALNIKYDIKGLENLEKGKRYILASNHPLGGPDGVILISFFGKHYGKIKFLVNDILLSIKNMDNVFIPINKHGKQSKEATLLLEEEYASDNQILIFPAGLVSRKENGLIRDLQWKKSFITKAIKHKRDIVPIYIEGKNSNFFYRLASIRKFLGIKANIEMLYLCDEFFKKRNTKFTLTIGKPIKHESLNNEKSHGQWADEIKRITYLLQDI